MARTWKDKHDHHKHPAHVERLARAYAGLPDGASIVIATPKEMSAYFRKVPRGKTRSMDDLRGALAKKHGSDGACPLTTGIFCRIAAEAALEDIAAGAKPAEVAPFWRVIDPNSPLARKLSCGPDFIRHMRESEGIAEPPPAKRKATKRA